MRRFERTPAPALALLLAALLPLASCGDDDDGQTPEVAQPIPFNGEMTVPDSWRGVLEMTF